MNAAHSLGQCAFTLGNAGWKLSWNCKYVQTSGLFLAVSTEFKAGQFMDQVVFYEGGSRGTMTHKSSAGIAATWICCLRERDRPRWDPESTCTPRTRGQLGKSLPHLRFPAGSAPASHRPAIGIRRCLAPGPRSRVRLPQCNPDLQYPVRQGASTGTSLTRRRLFTLVALTRLAAAVRPSPYEAVPAEPRKDSAMPSICSRKCGRSRTTTIHSWRRFRPKYSWTRIFRIAITWDQGTSGCRERSSRLNPLAASPMIRTWWIIQTCSNSSPRNDSSPAPTRAEALSIAWRISSSRSRSVRTWGLQGPGVAIDALPDARLYPAVAREVNLAAQQGFQFQLQRGMVQKAGVVPPLHQKVDVAVGSFFASGHGADEPYVGRPVAGREPKDFVSPAGKRIAELLHQPYSGMATPMLASHANRRSLAGNRLQRPRRKPCIGRHVPQHLSGRLWRVFRKLAKSNTSCCFSAGNSRKTATTASSSVRLHYAATPAKASS